VFVRLIFAGLGVQAGCHCHGTSAEHFGRATRGKYKDNEVLELAFGESLLRAALGAFGEPPQRGAPTWGPSWGGLRETPPLRPPPSRGVESTPRTTAAASTAPRGGGGRRLQGPRGAQGGPGATCHSGRGCVGRGAHGGTRRVLPRAWRRLFGAPRARGRQGRHVRRTAAPNRSRQKVPFLPPPPQKFSDSLPSLGLICFSLFARGAGKSGARGGGELLNGESKHLTVK